ncbi:MAG: aldehyde dehydrogenase family protein [Planctomycetes bacterium]|nr:aldehyde dehydrogenase family protein [Planctomycetota bacterium]
MSASSIAPAVPSPAAAPAAAPPRMLVSTNPSTGERLGEVRVWSAEEVRAAVAKARIAQTDWAARSFAERADRLRLVRERLEAETDDLATLIANENGKPRAEAVTAELFPIAYLINYFSARAEGMLSDEPISMPLFGWLNRGSKVTHRPYGVVGVIAPWNFPFAIPMGECVMALLAGNAVVLKPSEFTPFVGEAIGRLFAQSGLPGGLLTVASGDGSTGAALVGAGCDKIVFTGSVPTGRKIGVACAQTLTPCVLELGGKDPMIVCEDADVENAARGAVWGAFCNSGQVCASVERVYVVESVAADFLARVVQKTQALRQGSPLDPDTDVGPMQNRMQMEKVEAQVAAALASGAKALTGGKRSAARPAGLFYEPTVMVNVDHTMGVMKDETFGPVLPVMVVPDENEAVRLANDSPYGLTASVWTRDFGRGEQLARRIHAGTVMINECVWTHAACETPWGGLKESGIGRTHGRHGLMEFVQPIHLHENRWPDQPSYWWYPYSAGVYRMFRGATAALFSAEPSKRLRGAWDALAGFLSRGKISAGSTSTPPAAPARRAP